MSTASTGARGRGVALAAARIAVPVAYAALYYLCGIYLPTAAAAVVLVLAVLGMGAWLAWCLRADDDRRASHLAQQGFVAKVLVLPLEVVVVVVYAGTLGAYPLAAWLLSALAMYVGLAGGSAFVACAARQARLEGLVSPAWSRAFTALAFVPVLDALAAAFLWFALLRSRLLEG